MKKDEPPKPKTCTHGQSNDTQYTPFLKQYACFSCKEWFNLEEKPCEKQ